MLESFIVMLSVHAFSEEVDSLSADQAWFTCQYLRLFPPKVKYLALQVGTWLTLVYSKGTAILLSFDPSKISWKPPEMTNGFPLILLASLPSKTLLCIRNNFNEFLFPQFNSYTCQYTSFLQPSLEWLFVKNKISWVFKGEVDVAEAFKG